MIQKIQESVFILYVVQVVRIPCDYIMYVYDDVFSSYADVLVNA